MKGNNRNRPQRRRPQHNKNTQGANKKNLVLPSPAMLESYEEIAPGAVSKIVDMAKKEQAQRHKWENNYLRSMLIARRTGQLLAFTIAVIISYTIIVLATSDKEILAAVVAFAGYGSLFLAMVKNKFFSRNQRKEFTRPGRKS